MLVNKGINPLIDPLKVPLRKLGGIFRGEKLANNYQKVLKKLEKLPENCEKIVKKLLIFFKKTEKT